VTGFIEATFVWGYVYLVTSTGLPTSKFLK